MTSFFPVSVKESNGRNNYMINVGTNWNVAQVKREILHQSGLQAHQFKLVFAGQELRDNMTLEVLWLIDEHYNYMDELEVKMSFVCDGLPVL